MSNARFSILQARAVKDRRISDAQFRTLAALGMYADENGWCFPMLSTLGKDLSKSKQAVGRDTIALKRLGYLEIQARFNENGGRRSSKYRLRYDLPVNMDDSTPSTPEVDTPSTPEVDVNDPSNDPNKSFFTAEEQAQNEKKFQAILESERKSKEAEVDGFSWRGREFLPPQYLVYGDWFYAKTGLEMYGAKSKAKANSSWLKAFKDWWENDVTPAHLQVAFEAQSKWRMVSDPNQLTKDAAAVKASGAKSETSAEPKLKDGSGYV